MGALLRRRVTRVDWAAFLLALLAVLLGDARNAVAAGRDAAVTASVDKILTNDVANANYGDAKRKLKALLEQCKRIPPCTEATVARVDIGLGVIAAQLGQAEDAKATFLEALKLDPNATLPSSGATPSTKSIFAEAQKLLPPPPPPTPTTDHKNKDAADLAQAAAVADANGISDQCIEKASGALALEDQPRTRVLLATCMQKAGRLLDALGESKKALQVGLQRRDVTIARAAAARIEDILKKVPHVIFIPPTTGGVTDLKTSFDGKPLPAENWNKQISVNPGTHQIHAEGMANGIKLVFDQPYDIKEGELVTVQITLKPESPKFLTEGQLQCMRTANTQTDVAKCLPAPGKPLVVRVGLDMSAYADTTATRVYSPGIHGNVNSPTAGWNIGASYLIDVVTSASPDIVSTASRRFSDTRHAVSLNGGYKPGRWGFDASANYSVESDYISRTARVGVLGDFNDKRVTPRVAFGHSSDTNGRSGVGFSDYSRSFDTNEIDAGATFVLSPTSIFVAGLSAQFERGDQSKLYRLVPMFDNDTTVPIAASINSVNANRLAVRPYEQLPLERDRYALGGRFAKRLGTSTFRIEERFYRDSWTILATTTDLRYIMTLSSRLSVWPHAHVHAQTAANFFQRAYTAEIAPVVQVPLFRTTDRELSPFISLTAGGGARYELSPASASVRFALTAVADAMGSRYFNALYIRNRIALYGTLGIEAEFE